jgi:hypothetical protein
LGFLIENFSSGKRLSPGEYLCRIKLLLMHNNFAATDGLIWSIVVNNDLAVVHIFTDLDLEGVSVSVNGCDYESI